MNLMLAEMHRELGDFRQALLILKNREYRQQSCLQKLEQLQKKIKVLKLN